MEFNNVKKQKYSDDNNKEYGKILFKLIGTSNFNPISTPAQQ
jgi:hypothetical protein